MPINPADPAAAIAALAETVDKLSGQLAAVTAYLAHVAATLPDDPGASAAKGFAQQLAPDQLANPVTNHAPKYYASVDVDRIHAEVQKLRAIRSAGP